jgi:hypothetical protein
MRKHIETSKTKEIAALEHIKKESKKIFSNQVIEFNLTSKNMFDNINFASQNAFNYIKEEVRIKSLIKIFIIIYF